MVRSTTPSVTIALAGNPNAGKTSVFNKLTGGRQHVGNWPGVTVEKREGHYEYGSAAVHVVDLPGTYSLGTYSLDEVVARDFVMTARADVVVNVVDASNLERNLYLTTQLLEMGVNVVVALNMYDVASKDFHLDAAKISSLLGVPAVPTVATTGQGMAELKAAVAAATNRPQRKPPPRINYGHEIEPHIQKLAAELAQVKGLPPGISRRWLALKLLEGDEKIISLVSEKGAGARIVAEAAAAAGHLKGVIGDDAAVAIADYRYGFIAGLIRDVVKPRGPSAARLTASDRIDAVVTNRFAGIPIFLATAFALFELTFKIAEPVANGLQSAFDWLGGQVLSWEPNVPPLLTSFIVHGVLGGTGSVLVFVPNIFLLFVAIAVLEDSGYMARAAFILDEFMHRLSLHGRSFIPLMLGFGCNVPAVMATRTLETRRERMITLMVVPLMSCSARLPVYVLFAGAFFAGRRGLVVWSLYALGIVLAIAVAKLFSKVLFPGESAHFVMELPPYRVPTLRGALLHAWERTSEFVKRAGGIILAASILLWGLANLPPGVAYAGSDSLLGILGATLAPALRPAGFGEWQPAVALVAGVMAKEAVVSTLGVLYGAGREGLTAVLRTAFTPLSAYAFMVMSLIYIPCAATVAVIRRETGSWRWTLFTAAYTIILGWTAATLIYQGGRLLGLG